MRPGATALTRIPSRATSLESPMVIVSIAPFEAAYQMYSPGLPSVAAAELRLTMTLPAPGDSSVVHEMGDAPEARVGLGEEPLDVGFARNVGLDRDRLAAGPFYLGDDRRSSVGVPMVVHDDGVAALSGESAG